MSRIQACLDNLAKSNRKALISYVTAGDSHPDQTVKIMHKDSKFKLENIKNEISDINLALGNLGSR